MCGILCLVNTEFQGHPPCLNNQSSVWECQDTVKIRNIFKQDFRLSATDLNKLNNQEKLKQLNNQLIKLGNNVKVDNSEKIDEVFQQIKDITEEEPEDELTFSSSIEEYNHLIPAIAGRGPDYLQYNKFDLGDSNVQLFSSVLSLRQPFISQPVFTDRYVVQFNGELYNSQCEFSNDTEFLLNQIVKHGIKKALVTLSGEFAFCILDKFEQCVFFGRDSIGKRSLCYKQTKDEILISSVPQRLYSECEGNKLYKFSTQSYKLEVSLLTREFEELVPFNILNYNEPTTQVNRIYESLKRSCFIRQETICPLQATEASLAVLFSGGIDCAVIAALLIENFLELKTPVKIDLLTVGFDNPRTGVKASQSPDRQLSFKSWFHLAKKCSGTNVSLRLVQVDVDYKLWLTHKKNVVSLMYPQETEMDLSIAIAFYFASNNIVPCQKLELQNYEVSWSDFISDTNKYVRVEDYISSAKVLFSGLGADELFGGYSRHEAIFSSLKPDDDPSRQYEELNKQLLHDIEIIHKRNLGRDDRVISSWGKELRYPYLDNEFIKLVINSIEPNYKIKLDWAVTKKGKTISKPTRKWILRQLAGTMGLNFVKDELKRAIQFGAKSAKLEIGQAKARGTDELK
ncbi:hypothetical protein PSN45_004118 [Yamadazyma tenuis]|uniref:Glutamine amidotransferase type-2 domain-containing protein n=1 Tax=Candida tenuis (strain ATCC 10573 / BCRC 21748 / CBS 615 / JCM 9827 / NBRC 10315 / NRRL Y-1498 / VKM Y-70) TaxID=590646 RepID=G3B4F5_CANTC|nr:uncharacterized protein CANTEDRAFT_130203 [Yamadazyma tenuis ATCC 10573]EGV63812.1 hypothetical protein CANTEDRAFT_130203 [Yamadazyma tenuis ATCC 10573]WEJ96579.1 hypothetical protein PSN45_004118 [Yamadazyma tenuis]